MKKVIYSLSILLVISSSIISYLTVTINSNSNEVAQENRTNQIVLLGEGNSYNPILIIKND
ncbi:MAG: hypothetical protein CMP76_05075 [Flavobacterium sp.]|uniref:hypothetical protein n=1 Tax=unclassified Flavobacterium TaxID=196869 RepID=UPI000C5D63C5|nr:MULTISPECIES: hypothetical protein [unclassified Flavobacterium]MBF02648.1 hypothetical protein [Flavobacterium sp.]MCO6161650.1 hypothetical protein [Flavobacterium sp. NRK F7]